MRLLEKLNIFKKREESTTETTENVSNYISDGLLRALINDTPITKEEALSLPIVSSAVDLISNIIAMLPIYLYKEDATDEGKKQIEQINNDNRVFLLNNETGDTLDSLITEFFHILDASAMPRGSVKVETNHGTNDDITLYSCCMDLDECVYYYKTYNNNQINVIDIKQEKDKLNGKDLIIYPFNDQQSYNYVNKK